MISGINQLKNTVDPVNQAKGTSVQAVYGIGVYGIAVYGVGVSNFGSVVNQSKNAISGQNQAKS